MRFTLNIDYPREKMDASRKRLEARGAFRYTDRTPVGFCLVPRYFTRVFGIPYSAIFRNVEDHYHWQLQFLKYRIENIPEDTACTGTTLSVGPYFDNVLDSGAFGAEIVWPANETLHSQPTIHTVGQMERFEAPSPGSGLWGQARDWWLQMRDFARETRLTFNGVEGRMDVGRLGISGLSPHMIAIDLVGHDFYWWQIEYPAACHAFLAKITNGLIEAQRYVATVDDRPAVASASPKTLPRSCRSRCSGSSASLTPVSSSRPSERRPGRDGDCTCAARAPTCTPRSWTTSNYRASTCSGMWSIPKWRPGIWAGGCACGATSIPCSC
jgi:hypothetical protein